MYKISCMCKINSHSVVVVCLARVQTRDSETQRTAQLSHNHLSSTHAPRRLIPFYRLLLAVASGSVFYPAKLARAIAPYHFLPAHGMVRFISRVKDSKRAALC